jgi:hypothetical protein
VSKRDRALRRATATLIAKHTEPIAKACLDKAVFSQSCASGQRINPIRQVKKMLKRQLSPS